MQLRISMVMGPCFRRDDMSRKLLRRLQRRLRLFRCDPKCGGALEQEICTERECHPPDGKRAGDADQRDKQRNRPDVVDRKSTRLNSSHRCISYAVFCLKKKKKKKKKK